MRAVKLLMTSKVVLQSGSLILAIATFAAQHALGNVISGVSISVSKPYNEGEKIRVVQGGTVIAEGIVRDVTLRHTVIYQFNGESYIVPNSVMDTAVVINTNYTENIGNFIEVEISYDADIDEALRIIRKVCAEHELTLNTEEHAVTASGYTQNGIILKTTIWTENLDDSFHACSDIRIALITEFKKSGIEIPYQTVTVKIAPAAAIAANPADSAIKKDTFSFLFAFIKIRLPSVSVSPNASLISPPDTLSLFAILTPFPNSMASALSTDVNLCSPIKYPAFCFYV